MKREDKAADVSRAQMGIWAALILLEMTVVNCLDVYGETKEIQKEIVYAQVEEGETLPEKVTVDVEWEDRLFPAVCTISSQEVIDEYWKEDFYFPVTFHLYGAEYYQIGDKMIPYNENRPELEDCYGELLHLIGVSESQYKIENIVWAGDPYVDELGENCRDAVAVGRRLLRDWRVMYSGSVELPEMDRADEALAESVQEHMKESSGEEDTALEVRGGETRNAKETMADADFQEGNKRSTLWEKIVSSLLVVIGIGAMLFFGGLILLGIVRLFKVIGLCYTDKKRKAKYKEE